MKEIQKGRPNSNKGSKPRSNAEPHFEGDKTAPHKKKFKRRIDEKTYTITVTYVEVSEEEARIKRAIIEDIMRKPRKK